MSNGKGDTYRPVDAKKYAESFDRIFKKKPAAKMKKGSSRCSKT
jgi:hypothetical protein